MTAGAVVAQADVIVSNDDLLALERVGGIPVVGETQFLAMLEQGH